MFTVYNNGSVQFRSTSDNLYNLKNVDQSAQSRHKPDDDLYHSIDNDKDNKNKNSQNYTQQALQSYKKIAKINNNERIYHVQDIMTKEIISINSSKTVLEAYELLKEKKISQVPIITDNFQIVSMINKKIILNLLLDDFSQSQITLNKKLKNINFPQIITTDPISDIRRVAKVMIEEKLDAIPVVNKNDFLMGIVSKTDIIKAISHIPDLKLWA